MTRRRSTVASPEVSPLGHTAAPGSLDEAWAAAEAALPEGWVMGGLTSISEWDGSEVEWQAYAGALGDHCRTCHCHPSIGGTGLTPAAALLALASELGKQSA